MDCPWCGGPMERGYIPADGWLLWSEDEHRLFDFPRKNDVALAEPFTVNRPPAWLCRACRLVLMQYEE